MADPARQFFEQLARRDNDPLLENSSGPLRFDIADGKKTDHWFVTIDKGDVTVSHRAGEADATIADGSVFEGLARGEVSSLAAVLRGTLDIDGDPQLLSRFRRLLAGPPASRRRATARSGRSRR